LGPTPQADVTTPEKEELLLFPIRMPGDKTTPQKVINSECMIKLYVLIVLVFLMTKRYHCKNLKI